MSERLSMKERADLALVGYETDGAKGNFIKIGEDTHKELLVLAKWHESLKVNRTKNPKLAHSIKLMAELDQSKPDEKAMYDMAALYVKKVKAETNSPDFETDTFKTEIDKLTITTYRQVLMEGLQAVAQKTLHFANGKNGKKKKAVSTTNILPEGIQKPVLKTELIKAGFQPSTRNKD